MRQNKEEIARKEFLEEAIPSFILRVEVSQSAGGRGGGGFQAERAAEAKALMYEVPRGYGENLKKLKGPKRT